MSFVECRISVSDLSILGLDCFRITETKHSMRLCYVWALFTFFDMIYLLYNTCLLCLFFCVSCRCRRSRQQQRLSSEMQQQQKKRSTLSVTLRLDLKERVISVSACKHKCRYHSRCIMYLNMTDRVQCWDVWSGCWWYCWSHSCTHHPDTQSPERDWLWDQTNWCWTIHWLLYTRRESHHSHSTLMNTPMNSLMKMMMMKMMIFLKNG